MTTLQTLFSPEKLVALAKSHLTPPAGMAVGLYNLECAQELLEAAGAPWHCVGVSPRQRDEMYREAHRATALNYVRILQEGHAYAAKAEPGQLADPLWGTVTTYRPVVDGEREALLARLCLVVRQGGLRFDDLGIDPNGLA